MDYGRITLNQFDTSVLRNLVDRLSYDDVLVLFQAGDFLLNTKLSSQITTVLPSRPNLEMAPVFAAQVRQKSNDKLRTAQWLWPSILSLPLPKLTTFKVCDLYPGWLRAKLSSLPPTITRMTLKRSSLVVDSVEDLLFNLPSLVRLKISDVAVDTPAPEKWTISDKEWINPSLLNSPSIARLSYSPEEETKFDRVSSCVLECVHLLPQLEHLTTPGRYSTKPIWPESLHTLRIGQGEIRGCMRGIIPKSVTSLSLLVDMTGDECARFLEALHRNLLHLTLSATSVSAGTPVLKVLSEFTQLQTLRVTDPSSSRVPFSALGGGDNLSLLPPSLLHLSDWFAQSAEQWHNLPPKATLEPVQWVDILRVTLYTPQYCELVHSAYVIHFPKTLSRANIIHSSFPPHPSALQHVVFQLFMLRADIRYLEMVQSLSPTLVSLNIHIKSGNCLFWFGDHFATPRDSSSRRLPHLKSLKITLNDAVIQPSEICAWLAHVPVSVRKLQVSIGQNLPVDKPSFKDALSLEGVALPPQLTHLVLEFRDHLFELPKSLPSNIRHVNIEFFALCPRNCGPNLLGWPHSLKEVDLYGDHDIKGTSSLVRPSLTKLRDAIGKDSRSGKHKMVVARC